MGALRDWSVRVIKKANKDEQLGPEDVFSHVLALEGLKMLVSTMMAGHDDQSDADGPIEMATWSVRAERQSGQKC